MKCATTWLSLLFVSSTLFVGRPALTAEETDQESPAGTAESSDQSDEQPPAAPEGASESADENTPSASEDAGGGENPSDTSAAAGEAAGEDSPATPAVEEKAGEASTTGAPDGAGQVGSEEPTAAPQGAVTADDATTETPAGGENNEAAPEGADAVRPEGSATTAENGGQPDDKDAMKPAVRVVVLDLVADESTSALAKTVGGLVVATVAEQKVLDAVSGDEVARALESAAATKATGCEKPADCVAEIANALGASYAVFGDVGADGTGFVVNLSAFSAKEGAVLSTETVRADADAPLLEKVPAATTSLIKPVLEREASSSPEAVASSDEESSNLPALAVAGAGAGVFLVGVAGTVVGGLPLALAAISNAQVLQLEADAKATPDGIASAENLRTAAQLQTSITMYDEMWTGWSQYVFYVGLTASAVGAAVAGAGVGWFLLSGPSADGESE